MCEKCRRDCDSCQALLKKIQEDHLDICKYCGHYYIKVNDSGCCTCTSAEEEQEINEYFMCIDCQDTFPFNELTFGAHGQIKCHHCSKESENKEEVKKDV